MRSSPYNRAALVGLVVGVPVSALFLWLAVRKAHPREVRASLVAAEIRYLVLAVAAIAGVYLGQAVRWRAIARISTVSTARFGEMVVCGVAVNNVLPGRIGDLLRARWLQVAARIPGGRSLATVFVDRVFDVLALALFLAVSLPFVASANWLRGIAIGALVLLVALGLVLAAARVYTRRRARDRRCDRGLVRRLMRDTAEALSDPVGGRRGAGLLAISLGSWALWAVAAWLVGRSIGIEFSAIDLIFITAVINLGVAIPSSPGFIGTYQWLAVSVLALLDIGANRALAFAILMHAVWYVPTLVAGGVLLVVRGVRTVRTREAARMAALNEPG